MADVSQWNTEDKVISEILHQFFLKTKDLDKLMTPEDLANDLVSAQIKQVSLHIFVEVSDKCSMHVIYLQIKGPRMTVNLIMGSWKRLKRSIADKKPLAQRGPTTIIITITMF